MTDQETFEAWWESRDYDFQESCGYDNGLEVWNAAFACLREHNEFRDWIVEKLK